MGKYKVHCCIELEYDSLQFDRKLKICTGYKIFNKAQHRKKTMSRGQVEEDDYIVKKKMKVLLYIVAAVTESSE